MMLRMVFSPTRLAVRIASAQYFGVLDGSEVRSSVIPLAANRSSQRSVIAGGVIWNASIERLRIDLSELAGLLDFDGIDDSILTPEVIQDIKDQCAWIPDRHGLPMDVIGHARHLGRILETAGERLKPDQSPSLPTASN